MRAKIFLLVMTVAVQWVLAGERMRQSFDFGWQFRLGDVTAPNEPDSQSVDSGYQPVRLPHDWSTGFEFNEQAGPESGYLDGGIGWYRKGFKIPASYKGKRVSLVFDGIYHKASIYINGTKVAYHRYGYTSFEVNLTPYLNYGGDNVIAVRVDHSEKSRWYTGSGIYRHVWLLVTNPVHVKNWGTFVTTPEINYDSATVRCVTSVENNSSAPAYVEVKQYIIDNNGKKKKGPVAVANLRIGADTVTDIAQTFALEAPALWDLDNPNIYTLETVISRKGKTVDTYRTRFGVRSIKFDSEKGFFLNGKNIKMKGMCLHQDVGCFGTAVPDRAYERRLEILKEFGTNAIRCSHNPPSPEFLNLCDSIGFLVIDEAFDKWKSGYYEQFFDSCWKEDISDMIIRDRNHPSIVLWSIGNELAEAGRKDDVGVHRASMLNDFVHNLDSTRPTMLALAPYYQDKFAGVTDVTGYNYSELSLIEDKKKHPERIGLISESYPYYSGLRPYEARDYSERNPWNFVIENDFIVGSFMWAGAAYIGESMGWPSKGWSAAPFDLSMDEHPRGGYFRAMWNDKPFVGMAVVDYGIDEDPGKDHWQAPPMVHDWTFPYTDSRVLPIHTPSNCEEVVLIDPRGKKYGPRRPKDYLNNTIIWNQPYRPGTVTCIGYNGGKEVFRDSITTSALKASKYTISADRSEIRADGQDVVFVNLQLYDENDRPIRIDDRKVSVSVSGEGRLIGMNSGEMRRNEPLTSHELPTYFGRCQIVVQASRAAGQIEIIVDVEGLPSRTLVIKSI